MDTEAREKAAVEFFRLAASGRAREAADRFMVPGCVHHNPHVAAGMEALIKAGEADAKEAPDKQIDLKHVFSGGDLVTLHSHVVRKAGEPGFAVVHIYRFEENRIAELWDIAQEVPAESPNSDGMF